LSNNPRRVLPLRRVSTNLRNRLGLRSWAHLLVLLGLASCASMAGSTSNASAEFDLAHYRGSVVVVDFWASWCKPCRESFPWLNDLRARHGAHGLVIVGVNVDAERGEAERFLRQYPADFQVVFDPEGRLAREFKVGGMPSSFLFDRDGTLASQHLGFRPADRAAYEAQIQALLARTAAH
jgi:cytochrome c biogenesis protein CcmG/thiol:disulfide interchange protein DsbE